MAVAPLNLLAEHQAWFSNGLGFLLLERPVEEVVAECGRLASSAARSGSATAPGAEPAASAGGQSVGAGRLSGEPAGTVGHGKFMPAAAAPDRSVAGGASAVGRPRGFDESGPAQPSERSVTSRAAASSAPTPPLSAAQAVQAGQAHPDYKFDAENLPAAWKTILQKIAPGPVVWIYPELGQDLQGLSAEAGARRSAALRGIIGSLKLKKGTNAFWPVSVEGFEDSANGRVERDYFHGGLEHLGAKYLIVFGPSALRGTDFENLQLRPFTEQVCRGRLIIALPDFNELASDPARLQSVTVFLHSIFSRVF